jgi:hypothetical protein
VSDELSKSFCNCPELIIPLNVDKDLKGIISVPIVEIVPLRLLLWFDIIV